MARLTNPEPVLWTLFGAGGMVAAFLLPAHILVFGIMYPLNLHPPGTLTYETLSALAGNPLVKLYLMVLIPLPLFHAAHRLRFTLVELGLHKMDKLIAVLFYGAAFAMTFVTAFYVCGV